MVEDEIEEKDTDVIIQTPQVPVIQSELAALLSIITVNSPATGSHTELMQFQSEPELQFHDTAGNVNDSLNNSSFLSWQS